jgi:hypothetical protein
MRTMVGSETAGTDIRYNIQNELLNCPVIPTTRVVGDISRYKCGVRLKASVPIMLTRAGMGWNKDHARVMLNVMNRNDLKW